MEFTNQFTKCMAIDVAQLTYRNACTVTVLMHWRRSFHQGWIQYDQASVVRLQGLMVTDVSALAWISKRNKHKIEVMLIWTIHKQGNNTFANMRTSHYLDTTCVICCCVLHVLLLCVLHYNTAWKIWEVHEMFEDLIFI